MKRTDTSHMLVVLLTALLFLPSTANGQEEPSLRLREIYVPHEEFLERANNDPDGVIMDLGAYRALVLKGVEESRNNPVSQLPPVEAVVVKAAHTGKLSGKTARFTSKIEVRVTRDGWVRCPLDPVPAGLGSILVDGKPGWLVLPTPGPRQKKGPAPVAFLLLQGKGIHNVEIGFSLGATEKEERWRIQGNLPRAESARMILDVPGFADAKSNPPHLQALQTPGAEGSRLILSLGSSAGFSIDWRLKRAIGKSGAMLSALNGMNILPRIDDPIFVWLSQVKIQRRKTDFLDFDEPFGAQVLDVEGAVVHSWQRFNGRIRVLLKEATTGLVDLRFNGILRGEKIEGEPGRTRRYLVGPPQLTGALSNSGYIAVCSTEPERLELTASGGATEVALAEGYFPVINKSAAKRCFSYIDPAMRLELTARGRDRGFESRSAGLVRVLESGVTLDAIYHIDLVRGSEYRFNMSLPEPWRLSDLHALEMKGKRRNSLSWEIVSRDDGRVVEIELANAVHTNEPLVLSLRLEHENFAPGIDWPQRQLDFSVPHFIGAAKSKTDIGVKLPDSMFAIVPDLPGWEAMKSDALRRAGFAHALEADSGLAAGLTSTTEQAAQPITMTLNHRRPMGEFQSLTHLLALEGRVRVRTDLRLAIVDRAIHELRIELPVGTTVQAPVRGEGIKEILVEEADGPGSTRIVRYARPWTGTREIRIEYEADRDDLPEAGAGSRVPWIDIASRPGDPLAAVFDGDRRIVFQSLGAVKIEVDEGGEMVSADVDDLPELGQPWSEGRILFAFRFKTKSGKALPAELSPASFRVIEFDRAKILGVISREMELTTVIDPSGLSRTRLNAVIAYNKEHQHLHIKLPRGAKILSARVGDNPAPYVRKVQNDEKTELWQVPLPPLSYSQISLIYQRAERLGNWGTWTENGPVLEGVPVVATRWRVYHPAGYRFRLSGGNLLSADPSPLPASFLDLLFSGLSRGRVLAHGLLDHETENRNFFSATDEAKPEQASIPAGNSGQSAYGLPQNDVIAAQSLAPQRQDELRGHGNAAAPVILPFHLEGYLVETSKLGGEPVLSLDYRDLGWWRFTKRTVFILIVILGLWVAARHEGGAFWRFTGGGLFLTAILSDIAARLLGWESPFLLIPACEALGALLIGGLLFLSVSAIRSKLALRRKARNALAAAILLALAVGGALQAQDEILIPYDPADLETKASGGTGPMGGKAYLPYEKFRALWLLAHPEKKKDKLEAPADLVLGAGHYELNIEKETYRITGGAPLVILTDKWVTLPLPFGSGQLKKVLVDGKAVGVAQEKGIPFISLHGRGQRTLEVETTGPVESRLGSYSITSRLLSGPAARLRAVLPLGAQPSAPGSPAGLTFAKTPDATDVELDLGSSAGFTLGWTFPRIAGKQKPRLESTSFSDLRLALDGYDVVRTENITVTGAPAGSVSYEILGDWSITSVVSADLSEWTITDENETRLLNIFYSKPVQKARLIIRGWAPLKGDEEKQAASLSLIDALRQVSFAGIRHGARRRWRPGILSNQRAAIEKHGAIIKASMALAPDRLYQFFDSLAGQSVSAAAVTGTADATTNAVLFIAGARNVISARTRYQVNREGPLRQEVSLPTGWEFRNVQGSTAGEWEVVLSDDGPRLVVHFTRRAVSGTQVTWSAQRLYDQPQENIQVPLIRTLTAGPGLRSETVLWTIAAAEEIDVKVADGSSGIEKVARSQDDLWVKLPVPSRRLFDMRSTGNFPAYELSLQLGSRAGQPTAKTVLFARAAEDYILVNSQITISVSGGLEDTFRFRLPEGVNQAQTSLRTRNLKSLTNSLDEKQRVILELTLTSGIVGQHTVALSYRIPRGGDDADIVIHPVQTLRPDQADADIDYWVGLVETEQVLTNPKPLGLEKVRIADLPYLPEGVASESLHHAYRSTRSNWTLTLDPESLRPAETAQASIELADLVTVIGSDGTLRTKAVYNISNRKLQFLRIRLPDRTKLWGATLNGNPMVASQAEGSPQVLQVPLKHVGLGDLNLEVGIVYSHEKVSLPSLRGSLDLGAPVVLGQGSEGGELKEVTVQRTLWRVEVPEGYEAEMGDGNMQEVVSSIQYASKVESNLDDIEKLTGILGLSDTPGKGGGAAGKLNRRQRQQAALSLRRLQQALSDNVMDLEESNIVAGEEGQRRQLDGESLKKQLRDSHEAFDRGRQAQEKLEEAIKQTEKQGKEGRGKKEQAFEDNYNFKGNDWIRNSARQQIEGPGLAPTPSSSDLGGMLYKTPFTGFRPTSVPQAETEVEKARGQAVTSAGLKPLPPSRVSQVNPALETPPAPPGATSLTFRRPGGEAQLILKLSRQGLWMRFLSPALLLLAIAALGWRMGRARKNS